MKFEMPVFPQRENIDNEKEIKARAISDDVKKALRIMAATGVIFISGDKLFDAYESVAPANDKVAELSQKEKRNVEMIVKSYGDSIKPYLADVHKHLAEIEPSIPGKPTIEGFDEVGIGSYGFSDTWSEKYYPKGTINGQVESITCTDEKSLDGDSYVKLSKAGASDGRVMQLVCDKGSEIRDVSRSLDLAFSHELGHVNDWENKIGLTPEERVEFLADVTSVFESGDYLSFEKDYKMGDRHKYIEAIKDIVKNKKEYKQVSEYWAILCEYYLSFPESFAYMNDAEKKLIAKWLLRGESFDSEGARDSRKNLVDRLSGKDAGV